MRTENIEIQLRMPFYYNKPNLNGVVYTKEAIYKASNHFKCNLPIIFRDNNPNSEEIQIGMTTGHEIMVTDDNKNGRVIITVDGAIFFGGIDCEVKKCNQENGKIVIKDFDVCSMEFSIQK